MIKNNRGTILITTIWILTLLTLLAVGIGLRAAVDIKLTKYSLDSLKAHYIAEAGIKKTLALLKNDNTKTVDSLNETWSSGVDSDNGDFLLKDIKVGDGSFIISNKIQVDSESNPVYLYGAADEEGKLNLNKLEGTVISQIPQFSEEISQAIIDWRDEDDIKMIDGAESDYYEDLDNPYSCKNADLTVPEELMLIKDITADIYEKVKDIVTVYGDDKAVNINTAPKGVLDVIFGQNYEDLSGKVINYRNGSDGVPGTKDDNIFTNLDTISAQLSTALSLNQAELSRVEELKSAGYFKVVSKTFRINSEARMGGKFIKNTIEVVVKKSDNGFDFLYYHEK